MPQYDRTHLLEVAIQICMHASNAPSIRTQYASKTEEVVGVHTADLSAYHVAIFDNNVARSSPL